jgi:hypothetical protein
MKKTGLSYDDQHALACFFYMHHAALAIKSPAPRPGNIERTVMSVFGLVAKKGPYSLTPRGSRAVKLAKR